MRKVIVPVFAFALCVGTAFAEVKTGTPARPKPNTPTMGHRPIATWRTFQNPTIQKQITNALNTGNATELKKVLNENNIDINATNAYPNVSYDDFGYMANGHTLLTGAIDRGNDGNGCNLNRVKTLIQAGADLNARNGAGQVPMDYVRRQNCNADYKTTDYNVMYEFMTKAGAKPNPKYAGKSFKPTKDEKALIKAAKKGDTATVANLLAKGTDPNASDKLLNTALMAAVEAGQEETAKQLLAAGADVRILNANKQNALTIAINNKQTAMFPLLLQNGAYARKGILDAAQTGNIEILQALINAGAYLEEIENGETPLYEVISKLYKNNYDTKQADTLLQAGANVKYVAHGNSVLYYVSGPNLGNKRKQLLQWLKGYGAEFTEKDQEDIVNEWKQAEAEYEAKYGKENVGDIFVKGLAEVGVAIVPQLIGQYGGIPAATAAQAFSGMSTTSSNGATCGDGKHQFQGATCDKCVNNKPRSNTACAACCATLGKPIADNRYWPNGRAPKDGFTRPGCYCVFTDGSANIF